MKRRWVTCYGIWWMALALAAGCDATIHEYPSADSGVEEVVVVPLVDRMPPLYHKLVEYDEEWRRTERELPERRAQAYVPEEGYEMRVIVDVYEGDVEDLNAERRRVARHVAMVGKDALPPQDSARFQLPGGDYYVLAWADYTHAAHEGNCHYVADTLTNVRSRVDAYPANPHHRSSAVGRAGFSVDFDQRPGAVVLLRSGAAESRVVEVEMSRPAGRYRVVAADYDEFAQTGGDPAGLTVKVIYKQYVSAGYNVATGEPNLFVSTYSFNVRPEEIEYEGKREESLFGDYIFTSAEGETHVLADFYFYDAEGNEVSHCQDVDIPLTRNRETVVRGYFLTRELGEGNGVSIDENFEGEYVVEIN